MADPSLGFGFEAGQGQSSQDSTETTNANTTQTSKTTSSQDSQSISDILQSISNWANNLSQSGTVSGSQESGNTRTGGTATSKGTTTEQQASKTQGFQNLQELTDTTTTASKEAIAAARGNLNTATSGVASYKSDTLDVVNNIIQKAAVGFGQTRAQQNSSGLYNSTSNTLLTGFAAGQAASDAAATVLNYKTSEQQLAEAASGQLIDATRTTTGTNTQAGTTGSATTSTGSTTSSQVGTTDTFGLNNNATTSGSETNTAQQATGGSSTNTHNTGSTNTQSLSDTVNAITSLITKIGHSTGESSSTKESANLGISVICTELHRQGKMSSSLRFKSHQLRKYPDWGMTGYHLWATPVVRHLRKYPDGHLCILFETLFHSRANGNYFANKAIEVPSLLCGLYLLSKEQIRRFKTGVLHNG